MENRSNGLKAGRNDPCPCGSGKKYKKCCWERDQLNRSENPARKFREEMMDDIGDRVFESMEEAQQFVQERVGRKNRTPRDDFQGLSPEQMHRLLHFPFGSPDVVSFPYNVENHANVPILRMLELLAAAIGDKGLKPTATGNLPLAASREIAAQYLSSEELEKRTRFGDFRSEMNILELHTVRLAAMLAGLVRKYRGRFITSKACRDMILAKEWPKIYEKLFRTYIIKFNWAYPRAFIEVPFFQQSFAFSLYLLTRFGDQPRPASYYSDLFLNAFPTLINMEVPGSDAWSPRDRLKTAYSHQVLDTFGGLFGLVIYEHMPYGSERPDTVTVLPLLASVVDFRV
jgi:hypothetical protein